MASTSAVTCNTAPLPTDVVRHLFKTLLNTRTAGGRTYTNCLCLCNEWYDIGITMLTKDVVVNTRQASMLEKRVFTFRSTNIYLSRTRSYTIDLDPDNRYGYPDVRKVLTSIISARKLKTLSVSWPLSKESAHKCSHRSYNSHTILLHVRELLMLHESIENLELTMPGHCMGRIDTIDRFCIDCETLASVISARRLRNFRYCGEVCRHLFGPQFMLSASNKMENITINMGPTIGCYYKNDRCSAKSTAKVDPAADLALAARQHVLKGTFPVIQTFQIISDLDVVPAAASSREELGIVHRDIVTGKLVVYPYMVGDPYCWIRYQASPNDKILEKCAKRHKIAEELETKNWWQTSHGARLTETDGVSDYIWLPKPDIQNLKSLAVTWPRAPTLWKWEHKAETILLMPRFVDGVGPQNMLERNVCEDEKEDVRISDFGMTFENMIESSGDDATDESMMTDDSTKSWSVKVCPTWFGENVLPLRS